MNLLHYMANRKRVALPPIVPAGLILFSLESSAPTGWTRLSAADDRLVVGAGNTYANGATGGAWTAATWETSGDGSHRGHPNIGIGYRIGDPLNWLEVLDDWAGHHTHVATLTFKPERERLLLIKNDENTRIIPANSIVLAAESITGLSAVLTNGLFLMAGSSVASLEEEKSVALANSGLHQHKLGNQLPDLGNSQYDSPWDKGTHTHSVSSVSVTNGMKKAILRALRSVDPYILQNNMIGMWDGAELPEGWLACDGTGGTVNLQDRFIAANSAGDGTLSGDNKVNITGTVANLTAGHTHYGAGSNRGENVANMPVGNETWLHNHNAGKNGQAYVPPYYGLTFIMYAGG